MPEPIASVAVKVDSLLGFSVTTFIWGVLGSAVSMRFLPQMTFWQKFMAVVSGTIMAAAGTPVVGAIFGLKDDQVLYGAAFFIGVFGLSLTASIFEAIRKTQWAEIIKSRLGGTPPGDGA